MRFWTSFRLNWLEFHLLEHSFYNICPISAHFGANYNKRFVAILYSKIINIILIFRSAMAVLWDPVLLYCCFFIVITMGQKEVAQTRCVPTDEVEF